MLRKRGLGLPDSHLKSGRVSHSACRQTEIWPTEFVRRPRTVVKAFKLNKYFASY